MLWTFTVTFYCDHIAVLFLKVLVTLTGNFMWTSDALDIYYDILL